MLDIAASRTKKRLLPQSDRGISGLSAGRGLGVVDDSFLELSHFREVWRVRGFPSGKAAQCLAGVFLVFFTGCGPEFPPYPSDLKYPARTEPIITATVTTIPPNFERPGELFQILWGLEPEDRAKNVLYPKTANDAQRARIAELEDKLVELFGSPSQPKVNGIDDALKETLQLDNETLDWGARLYRVHCLHCHGVAGNGRGPTAPWVNPHPRDYRLGKFKFISTKGSDQRKPRRADFLRTLREGIPPTSMPSFGLLPEEELNALVSYVIHLTMRGPIEFQALT